MKGEPALLVFTDAQKFVDLQKAIEEKNKRLQVLVNSLAIENQRIKNEEFEMKDRMKKLTTVEKDNSEIKNNMKTLEAVLLKMRESVSEMRKEN